MTLNYREQLIQTINRLIDARDLIFDQIVNLAMSNEYKQLDNVFEQGEAYEFSLGHFEKMDDINIQKLVTLCKNLEETIFMIIHLNGISLNEINIDYK